MYGYLSYVQKILNTSQKLDSFASHYEQHLNSTPSSTDLHTCMTFSAVKQLKPIGTIKSFMKPN